MGLSATRNLVYIFKKKRLCSYFTITDLGVLFVFFAILISYLTPSYFDPLDFRKCSFVDYSNLDIIPIPSNLFQARWILQDESFCLPNPSPKVTGVHLNTIIVSPKDNTTSFTPEQFFFHFLHEHETWIDDRISEGSVVWYRDSRNRWTDSKIDENLSAYDTIRYFMGQFFYENLPHRVISVTPHQHLNPGYMLMFVKDQTPNPMQGLTSFHFVPENFSRPVALESMRENGSPFEPIACFLKTSNCTFPDDEERAIFTSREPIEYNGLKKYTFLNAIGSLQMSISMIETFDSALTRLILYAIFKSFLLFSSKPEEEELRVYSESLSTLWQNSQIIRPTVGDVMISHGWLHMHARIGGTAQGKEYKVRELFPCDYIKDEYRCMSSFNHSAEAEKLKDYYLNSRSIQFYDGGIQTFIQNIETTVFDALSKL